MRNLDLAARVLLDFVDLFTSSANDFGAEEDLEVCSQVHNARILITMNVFVLTETNHAVRHTALFRHCRGPSTRKTGNEWRNVLLQNQVPLRGKRDTFVGTEQPAELQSLKEK